MRTRISSQARWRMRSRATRFQSSISWRLGARLCLDFCNTSRERVSAPEERFRSYPEVVGWAWRAGVLNAEEAGRLARLGARNPTQALLVHERALRLRQSLRAIFTALAGERRIRSSVLEVLHEGLAAAMARAPAGST